MLYLRCTWPQQFCIFSAWPPCFPKLPTPVSAGLLWRYINSFSTAGKGCLLPSLLQTLILLSEVWLAGGGLWVSGERPWGTAHPEAPWGGVRKWTTLKGMWVGAGRHGEMFLKSHWKTDRETWTRGGREGKKAFSRVGLVGRPRWTNGPRGLRLMLADGYR